MSTTHIEGGRPVQLQLNNAGSWKTLAKFDAGNDDQADKARMVGQLLGELGGPRTTLRIATCEALPIVLVQWSAGKGWAAWVHPGDRA